MLVRISHLFVLLAIISSVATAQCPQATVTVEIRTDDYGSDASWELFDQNTSTLVAGGGNYGDNMLYSEDVCVSSAGCYLFIIYDAFNDGLCCVYDSGYYHVYYNGALAGSGGEFASSESTFDIGNNCSSANSSITTDNSLSPQQLVTDILLGSCVEAFNIAYTGSALAIGNFGNGGALGIDSGILITTGSHENARGPNNSSSASWLLGRQGDDDLDSVAGVVSQDAAALEFDFIPYNDTIVFDYVFASEEYPEFVCSQYNDVFAFLVSGPGFAPNTNVALIPGTAIEVAINSINSGTAGGLNNPANCTSLAYSSYYRTNITPAVTQYDAYTAALTAMMVVVPCSTYHIKFVIGDVGDFAYDSGVFIEARSFSGGQSVGVSVSTTAGSGSTYEGCDDGQFIFFREGSNTANEAVTVNFTVTGTATEGIDYPAIPHSVTIPANGDSAAVSVSPVLDALPEGVEAVIITYQDECACGLFKRDTLFIGNNSPIAVSIAAPDSACQGQTSALTATASGSLSLPYTYTWSSGHSTDSISIVPSFTGTYTVTVTDACGGQSATASHLLTVYSCSDPCDTLVCDDSDPCTIDTCLNGGCAFTPDDCDDGNGCTSDACIAGDCVYTPISCDDGDPCTIDQCASGICRHANATMSADSLVIRWWFENCCCR